MKLGITIALVALVGCASLRAAQTEAADDAYTTEHVRCSDKYDTKEEIDACRAAVRIRWNAPAPVRDAGGDE